jgi:cytochrome P450
LAPAAPTGVPHATLEEDVYRGWRIPKGSIVFANAYGMNRDERVYPNPHKFDPGRFIQRPENPAQPDPAGTFGFGRR